MSIQCQLTAGWRQVVDKTTGQKYYYNKSLNKTQWDKPKNAAMVGAVVHLSHLVVVLFSTRAMDPHNTPIILPNRRHLLNENDYTT